MSTNTTDKQFSFTTPAPIEVSFDLQAARLELLASDRSDTVVSVGPRNPNRQGDLNAVQQTTAELVDGKLTVFSPRTSPVPAAIAAIVCERLWVSAPSTIISLVHLFWLT